MQMHPLLPRTSIRADWITGSDPGSYYWSFDVRLPSQGHSSESALPQSHRLRLSGRLPNRLLFLLKGFFILDCLDYKRVSGGCQPSFCTNLSEGPLRRTASPQNEPVRQSGLRWSGNRRHFSSAVPGTFRSTLGSGSLSGRCGPYFPPPRPCKRQCAR